MRWDTQLGLYLSAYKPEHLKELLPLGAVVKWNEFHDEETEDCYGTVVGYAMHMSTGRTKPAVCYVIEHRGTEAVDILYVGWPLEVVPS